MACSIVLIVMAPCRAGSLGAARGALGYAVSACIELGDACDVSVSDGFEAVAFYDPVFSATFVSPAFELLQVTHVWRSLFF